MYQLITAKGTDVRTFLPFRIFLSLISRVVCLETCMPIFEAPQGNDHRFIYVYMFPYSVPVRGHCGLLFSKSNTADMLVHLLVI